jgi:hypothetical protein
MSDDRKIVAMDPEVFQRLKEQKGQYETWNQLLSDAADLLDEHHEPPTLGTED